MRFAIVACLVVVVLSGCSSARSASGVRKQGTRPSVDASSGAQLPRHDPSLPSLDDAGRTAGDAVLSVVEALNAHRWEDAYSQYATPAVDLSLAKRQWEEADESFRDFKVLEVRVVARDLALVRVAYRTATTPAAGQRYSVVVDPPGEWWQVRKVDGHWRTGWMPRQ